MITINKNPLTQFAHLAHKETKRIQKRRTQCNLCRRPFTPEFRYQKFCGKCRAIDESFMFNEWLPRAPEDALLVAT
jgi:hypothetical protein